MSGTRQAFRTGLSDPWPAMATRLNAKVEHNSHENTRRTGVEEANLCSDGLLGLLGISMSSDLHLLRRSAAKSAQSLGREI